jgi:hypothetical protein
LFVFAMSVKCARRSPAAAVHDETDFLCRHPGRRRVQTPFVRCSLKLKGDLSRFMLTPQTSNVAAALSY